MAGSNQIRDEQGHGTSVAGIIAAEGNNTLGTTGIMWRAGLMSLRVLDNTGTGDVADAVEAIDYAVRGSSRSATRRNCEMRTGRTMRRCVVTTVGGIASTSPTLSTES